MPIDDGIFTGAFDVGDGRTVFGSLEISGPRSTLSLYDQKDFLPIPEMYSSLSGSLHSGDCVSLIDCVLLSIDRSQSSGVKRHSARLFTNTIVVGSRKIDSCAEDIESISISFMDQKSIFYMFDAFGPVLDPAPFLPLLIADKAHIRPIAVGERPIIGYFSGLFDIAAVDTCFGDVKTSYRVSERLGGPSGWGVSGQAWTTMKFRVPLAFSDAMSRAHALIRFFETICGRTQELLGFEIRSKHQVERERSLDVYEAHGFRASSDEVASIDGRRRPGPRDVLLCTIEGSESYSRVLSAYLDRDVEWGDARCRFRDNLRRESAYSIDRIVAAANMFDILPATAVPSDVDVADSLRGATEKARAIFKSLPESIDRSSVLNALGRVGKPNLKQKVLHRMAAASLDRYFPGIDRVLKEAVNCRNHYVHGTRSAISYSENFDVVGFLTNSLEFVFGVSDLVECGWDLGGWLKGSPQSDHPFGDFVIRYKDKSAHLLSLLDASA